jgi:hypothetical protein
MILKSRDIRLIFLILTIFSTLILPISFILRSSYLLRYQASTPIKIKTSRSSIVKTWVGNGIIICDENYDQWYPQICSDKSGGAIITWEDERGGEVGNIFAQRINSMGNLNWTANGVAICTENNTQGSPQICSDGTGGAIITWNDKRNNLHYDIYAQKINFTGDIKWDFNGTEICTMNESQVVPQICSDGNGGAIITWTDYRNGNNYDIFVQRINSSGSVMWNVNGTEICTEGGDQIFPKICSDGTGGAILTWEDSRGADTDIYAQRVNSTGGVQWISNGVPICTANNTQWYPKICSDGIGGAIITWEDYRSDLDYDIYAQYINSTGHVLWIANGSEICTATGDQERPQICSNGHADVIITWQDSRGADTDIYAQMIDSTGDTKWVDNGVVICSANEDQEKPQICSDGNGGAIITWEDWRDIWGHIYAQQVNISGKAQGSTEGVVICTAPLAQKQPRICSDEDKGAIITWFDKRNGVDYDIYAQWVKIESLLNGGKPDQLRIIIIISLTFGGITVIGIIGIYFLRKRRKDEYN